MTLQYSMILGEIDYYGKTCTAIREVYEDGSWRLVFVCENDRIVMMVY